MRNEWAVDSDLFIFSDAAKNEGAIPAVRQVREVLRTATGFKTVNIVERERNLGLANSIAAGVTQLCEATGRAIVLEDDLVTAPNFLRYMNEALDKYATQPDVYSISGYSFTNDSAGIDSTYFLGITSSWGWATWGDKWKIFERNREALAEKLKSIEFRKRFNYDNSYDYSRLAENQLAGKTDSWAIYWYFCIFLRAGLTLYTGKSLVKNIGFDGTGTHCDDGGNDVLLNPFEVEFTDDIFEKKEIRKAVQTVLRGQYPRPSLYSRIRAVGTQLWKVPQWP